MRICVTQKDIDNGKKFDEECCPVALALKRRLNCDLSVGSRNVRIHQLNKPYKRINLPEKVKAFVDRFDYNGKESVKPFQFELDI